MNQLYNFQQIQYSDTGTGDPIVFLHGLFGALSNFDQIQQYLIATHRVIIPELPLFHFDIKETKLESLVDFLDQFLQHLDLKSPILIGNSLGGHLALLYALTHPKSVQALVLTASSGLFEDSLGASYPRRDREWLRQKIAQTFGKPQFVTEELIDQVYHTLADRSKTIRIIQWAKSATRHNLQHQLANIQLPTHLIWGTLDTITPPFVAEQFLSLLPHATLTYLPEVGHAPMMEDPLGFYHALKPFLDKLQLINL